MLGIFKKQKGTQVSLVVEYVLDYDEIIDEDNVNSIVEYKDLLRDPSNIRAIKDIKFKAIK